jgi:hypothetical protein
MAVPDAEFIEICRRLVSRQHGDHITLITREKEHIKFYRKGDKVKAIRVIDGKPTKFSVEPLSKVMPQPNTQNEREWLKSKLKEANPEYNNARLDLEADMIYEMRKSVAKLVEETGCKPEQAIKALEMGMASADAMKQMESVEKLTAFTTQEIKEGDTSYVKND